MGILGGIGASELIIILIICLLIFGPKNLPKLGASLGKTMKGIRKGMEEDEPIEAAQSLDAENPKITASPDQVISEEKNSVVTKDAQ